MSEDGRTSGPLQRLVNRRKPDGTFYYTNSEVEDVLPVLVLCTPLAADISSLEEPMLRMVVGFLAKLGVNLDQPDPEDFDRRLRAYWHAHPPNPELMQEIRNLAVELRTTSDRLRMAASAAKKGLDQQPPTRGGMRPPQTGGALPGPNKK